MFSSLLDCVLNAFQIFTAQCKRLKVRLDQIWVENCGWNLATVSLCALEKGWPDQS